MTTTDAATQPLLDVRHVRKYFPVNQGVLFRRPVGWIKAVDDVAFAIAPGQTFGLVGESGCGKSTLAKLILLLEPLTDGEIMFEGQSVARLSGEGLKRYGPQWAPSSRTLSAPCRPGCGSGKSSATP